MGRLTAQTTGPCVDSEVVKDSATQHGATGHPGLDPRQQTALSEEHLVGVQQCSGEPSDPVANPLLRMTVHPRGRTISASMLTRSISEVINAAGLSHLGYAPHSFRRGGASCSHHDGSPMEAIKFHGTWSSNAVHRYLLAPPEFKSPIIKAFKARFK